jgi:hypothetical protein
MGILLSIRRVRRWWRNDVKRRYRQRFVWQSELNFVRVMNGTVITLPIVRDHKGRPLVLYMSGKWFKQYDVEHQYKVRGYHIDFAVSWLQRGIEINGAFDPNGRPIHDIVKDQRRRDHLKQNRPPWNVLDIPAIWLEPNSVQYRPDKVRQLVHDWIGPELPKTSR